MSRTGQPSTRDVEATVRAVEILDALADGGELGTSDVARRTGISPSTVSRQLGTLTRAGLVEHVSSTGRYRLGVRTLRYANAVLGRLNLRDLARPHLEELVHRVGETATLSLPGDADAITVDFVPTDRYLQGVTRLGRPSVGHASSAGKVMLAFGDVPLPRGRLVGLHAEHDRRPAGARGGDRARPGAPATPRRSRSARPASRPWRRRSGMRPARSPPSSPCRAPRAASTALRSTRRCRSSSPAPSASRGRSAGAASGHTWPERRDVSH